MHVMLRLINITAREYLEISTFSVDSFLCPPPLPPPLPPPPSHPGGVERGKNPIWMKMFVMNFDSDFQSRQITGQVFWVGIIGRKGCALAKPITAIGI